MPFAVPKPHNIHYNNGTWLIASRLFPGPRIGLDRTELKWTGLWTDREVAISIYVYLHHPASYRAPRPHLYTRSWISSQDMGLAEMPGASAS